MKQYFALFILFFIAITLSAQNTIYDFDSKIEVKKKEKLVESPYSMFGDNTAVLQTKHEDEKDHTLKIPIIKDNQLEGLFRLDFQTGIVSIYDNKENVLSQEELMKESSARFTSIDPMAEKYYSISPYVYVGNNPINAIDLRGDTITTIINSIITNADGTTSLQSDRYYYGQDANGNFGFIGANGHIYSGNNQFVNSLSKALGDLGSGGNVGQSLVNNLMNSTKVVNIAQGNKNAAALDGSYITWNPNSTTGGMNTSGNENRPSYIGLGHEMGHIQDTWNGTIDSSPWVTVGQTVIPNSERYATHIENQLRAENNIPLRTHYGIDASTGTRRGLGSTRVLTTSGVSKFYQQPNGVARGIQLLPTPFRYR